MAATLVFLGLAFRRLYLQPQVCEPGAACVQPAVFKRQRLIFWVVAVLPARLAVSAVGGVVLPLRGAFMRKLLSVFLLLAPLAVIAATPRSAVLDVQNMTCELCPVTVKKSLEKVPGVSKASIDFASKTATVTFDADRTSLAVLVKATANAGYPSAVRK